MSDEAKLYFNPKCSKCRMSMELLNEHQIETDIIEYLDTPPNRQEIENILSLLAIEPRELMRDFEPPYEENNLGNPDLTRDELIQAMLDYPILIQRPIVIYGDKAVIGRPPEKILDILK